MTMRRPVEIREIRPADLHDVFVLGREMIPGHDGNNMLLPWNETNLAGVLSEVGSRSFVAARKKAIEGFLVARITNSSNAEIIWTAARGPEAARIRENLYRALINSLPEAISRIMVSVPGSNTELIGFFGKFGFTDSEHVIIMENFFRKNM